RSMLGRALFLKCEGLNFAGSIKLKAAASMVEAAERDGLLRPGSMLVESSSGNLGVALSMIAASRGYRFVCVTDTRCNLATKRLMEALGAEVHTIVEPHPTSGFLGARLNWVKELLESDRRFVWLNQYSNSNAWRAHYRTTGTLMGCARFFRQWHRRVRVVAIDSVGSVAFGARPGRRMIPGLGTGVRPELLDESFVDDVVWVEESDTVRSCHRLARTGFLFGGS